jgi:hypothetical protein
VRDALQNGARLAGLTVACRPGTFLAGRLMVVPLALSQLHLL